METGVHGIAAPSAVYEVGGHKILFVDPTSRVVDHEMIRAWLQANAPVTAFHGCDPRKGLNIVDAGNFHNVLPRTSSVVAAGAAA